MSLTPYPTLRLKLTMPQALKLRFLPAIPGTNAAASATEAEAAAAAAEAAAATAVAATANKVDRSGDTMTGFLTLNADPAAALHAATKQYVDATAGGGAPTTAEYVTTSPDAVLTNERVLTNTATVTWDFATAGQAKANAAAVGGGNVSNSGTPAIDQLAQWVTATTIKGLPLGATMSLAGGVLNTTAGGGNVMAVNAPANGEIARWTSPVEIEGVTLSEAGIQPLDADLTALAALTGTNTIYFRSAVNTWSPVTVSTGLAFSGGNLTATSTGTFTAATTAPSSPNSGDFWYDLSTGTLSIYINDGSSSQWVQVSPNVGGGGNFLARDVTSTISVGYTVAPANLGSITSFTVNPALGNYQYGTNNGAATWTAPTSDCAVDIMVTNGATAGAITFSGFTVGSNIGDPPTTTNAHKFIVSVRRINATSTYTIKALQ